MTPPACDRDRAETQVPLYVPRAGSMSNHSAGAGRCAGPAEARTVSAHVAAV